MEERDPARRGQAAAGGRTTAPARPLAPALPRRAVVVVGPGSRPPAGLSPIAPVPGPRPTSTGGLAPGNRSTPRPVGPGAAPASPRAVPAAGPRPMHPPIGRVPHPIGPGPTALQASIVATRPGAGPAGARGTLAPGARTATAAPSGTTRLGFGMPSLRRNVCPHFYMTGARGAIPIQAPHLLKALVRQEANVSRCQLRGGVHLEQGYVNDVCLSARFNQCVFYEDDLTR